MPRGIPGWRNNVQFTYTYLTFRLPLHSIHSRKIHNSATVAGASMSSDVSSGGSLAGGSSWRACAHKSRTTTRSKDEEARTLDSLQTCSLATKSPASSLTPTPSNVRCGAHAIATSVLLPHYRHVVLHTIIVCSMTSSVKSYRMTNLRLQRIFTDSSWKHVKRCDRHGVEEHGQRSRSVPYTRLA